MTYLGAIKQLHELRNAEDMPFYYKPAIAEVINVLLMDAQEVKHGHWTVTPIYIICSECGESFPLVPQNYCPNCGALMDEVEE